MHSAGGEATVGEPQQVVVVADTAGMAKKPKPPKPITWTIYKIAARQTWLGSVEATNEVEAIEKAADEFKTDVSLLPGAKFERVVTGPESAGKRKSARSNEFRVDVDCSI